jgi:hypothetical protein
VQRLFAAPSPRLARRTLHAHPPLLTRCTSSRPHIRAGTHPSRLELHISACTLHCVHFFIEHDVRRSSARISIVVFYLHPLECIFLSKYSCLNVTFVPHVVITFCEFHGEQRSSSLGNFVAGA